MNDWIEITMKFNSKCKECGEDMSEGERGLWLKGEGVKHINCEGIVTTYELKKKEPEEIHDNNKYSYIEATNLDYCQYCGKNIDKTKDQYMNNDRKSCNKCFMK